MYVQNVRGLLMTYNLYVYNKRTKEYEKKGEYKTKQMAETKSKLHTEKNRKVKIIPIPTDELKIGLKVYRADSALYGEIIDESDSFWYVRREFKDENDRVFFLKDEFIDKYESGIFIMKEECE